MSLHRDNHYVPCVYLKGFSSSPGRVQSYALLVEDARVPLWIERSVKGVACHQHLYTRLKDGDQSDEVERWLDREFETPAAEAIDRAITGNRLTQEHWRRLVRFLAAQDVRTPARFAASVPFWHEALPSIMNNALSGLVQKLETAKQTGKPLSTTGAEFSDYFPLRLDHERVPGTDLAKLQVSVVAGRSLWLYQIKRLLTHTVEELLRHKWSIICAPDEITWFTSDNPVVKLNFHAPDKYDFGGGWGSVGTDILMPLSSKHLLHTRIGYDRLPRGWTFPVNTAAIVRRIIAEHAHRYIFADHVIHDVPELRPRVVDAEAFRSEAEQWTNWNENQITAETKLKSENPKRSERV